MAASDCGSDSSEQSWRAATSDSLQVAHASEGWVGWLLVPAHALQCAAPLRVRTTGRALTLSGLGSQPAAMLHRDRLHDSMAHIRQAE